MVTGLTFSGFYIVAPTFLVIGCSHFTPAFSISRAIKSPHLLSSTKVVFVSVAARLFENIQDATIYNEFLEVVSDNKE